MPRGKIKFALRIRPEVQQLVKDMCLKDNCQSQNEFIEKAIRFYAGYVSAQDCDDFLPPIYLRALRGTIQDTEDRVCRLLCKLAVEVDLMMHVLAAGLEIPEEQIERLRPQCVRNVKRTSGSISLDSAIERQRGAE